MKTPINLLLTCCVMIMSMTSCNATYSGYHTPSEVIEQSIDLFESVQQGDFETFTSFMLAPESKAYGTTDKVRITTQDIREQFFEKISRIYAEMVEEAGSEFTLTHIALTRNERNRKRNEIQYIFSNGTTSYTWYGMQWFQQSDGYYFELLRDDFGKRDVDIDTMYERLEEKRKKMQENPDEYGNSWIEVIEL